MNTNTNIDIGEHVFSRRKRDRKTVLLEVIDIVYGLPKRYHAAMLHLLLNLRRLPQALYDDVTEAVALRALERRLNDHDVEALASLLIDERVDEDFLVWFVTTPYADLFEVEARLKTRRRRR